MIKAILFDLNGVLFSFNNGRGVSFNEENVLLVKNLSRNYKLGVISNAGEEYKEILESQNIAQYFDVLIFSESIGFSKPNPEIFNVALHKLSVKPEEVVFIDDFFENTEAGRALGLNCILYKNPIQLKEDLIELGVRL